MLRTILLALAALFSLSFVAMPLSANTGPLLPAAPLTPHVSPLPLPASADFSDSEFASADQPEIGTVSGGDVLGFLVFVLVVALIVLLILWLVREGHLR